MPCSKQKAVKFLTHVYPEIISKDWINHKCNYNSTLTTNLPTEKTTNVDEKAQGEKEEKIIIEPAYDGNIQLSEDELEEILTTEKGDSHTKDDTKRKAAKRKSKEIETTAAEKENINQIQTSQKQNISKKAKESKESTSSKTPRSTHLLNKAKVTPSNA
jgi:hypothetical protein